MDDVFHVRGVRSGACGRHPFAGTAPRLRWPPARLPNVREPPPALWTLRGEGGRLVGAPAPPLPRLPSLQMSISAKRVSSANSIDRRIVHVFRSNFRHIISFDRNRSFGELSFEIFSSSYWTAGERFHISIDKKYIQYRELGVYKESPPLVISCGFFCCGFDCTIQFLRIVPFDFVPDRFVGCIYQLKSCQFRINLFLVL